MWDNIPGQKWWSMSNVGHKLYSQLVHTSLHNMTLPRPSTPLPFNFNPSLSSLNPSLSLYLTPSVSLSLPGDSCGWCESERSHGSHYVDTHTSELEPTDASPVTLHIPFQPPSSHLSGSHLPLPLSLSLSSSLYFIFQTTPLHAPASLSE